MILTERNLVMESNNLPSQKQSNSSLPLMLTPSEIESLKQDLQEASEWIRQELQRNPTLIQHLR